MDKIFIEVIPAIKGCYGVRLRVNMKQSESEEYCHRRRELIKFLGIFDLWGSGCMNLDYFSVELPRNADSIVSNPAFELALHKFGAKIK